MPQQNEGPTSKPQVRRSARTRAAKTKSKTALHILDGNLQHEQVADASQARGGDVPLKPTEDLTAFPCESLKTETEKQSESLTSPSSQSKIFSDGENDHQVLENSNRAQSETADELPRMEDLVVRTSDGLRPARNGDLFRRSDDVIWHLKLEKRTVAVACGCGQADCNASVQVGTHGNHAMNASTKCVHCGSGPFSGPATANKHWRDGTCKNKREKGVITLR